MNSVRISCLALSLLLTSTAVHAAKTIPFEGRLDLVQNELNVVFQIDTDSSLAATAIRDSDSQYRFSIDIEHLKTPLFDLLSKIESSVEVIDADGQMLRNPSFKGKVWSQYSLVDYKPVRELTGGFEINDRRLHLTEFSFGNLSCNGYVDLDRPYAIDMTITLMGMGMDEFLNFWSADTQYESAGAVTGEIKASGTLDNLMLKGSLESRNGFVQKLDYDSIVLNIEGLYPHMDIAHSTISKSDGVSFTFEGPFNLSDRANFKKQIKDLNIAPLVSDTGTEREWTIKKLSPDDAKGTTELKYRLREGDALGIGTSAGDESDMFGFERTRKF